MLISSKEFFSTLIVDTRYYTKIFLNFGVKSSFFFDKHDLQLIVNNLRTDRYKSAIVVQRAKSFLEDLPCQN